MTSDLNDLVSEDVVDVVYPGYDGGQGCQAAHPHGVVHAARVPPIFAGLRNFGQFYLKEQ